MIGPTLLLEVALVTLLSASDTTWSGSVASEPIRENLGAELEMSYCALMTDGEVEGDGVNELQSIALEALASERPGMKFRFVRAIRGPLSGHTSLLYVNLTYSDQYFVVVAEQSHRRFVHSYVIGSPFYPDWECKSGG